MMAAAASVFPPCKMKSSTLWLPLFISCFLLFNVATAADNEVGIALITFLSKLSNNDTKLNTTLGWDSSTDPCKNKWNGITCDVKTSSVVKKIILDSFSLSGVFNPTILCNVPSLANSLNEISLLNNSIHGEDLEGLENCRQLLHLLIGGNQFTGALPDSLASLNNLKTLEISNNGFSGSLPDLARISGLTVFLAQNNLLSGPIPNFDFSNFKSFNVSNNSFSGPIPKDGGTMPSSSFSGNAFLCGAPLSTPCHINVSPTATTPTKSNTNQKKKHGLSPQDILIYVGYGVVGLLVFLFIAFKVCRKDKGNVDNEAIEFTSNGKAQADDQSSAFTDSKPSLSVSNKYNTGVGYKSETYSASADQSVPVSSSLIVLTSPEVNGLKFEDLLKAPAELVGRGRHGSVYKVNCEERGMTLAVKRIKDWNITSAEFKLRMKRLDRVKHPNVMAVYAFYCSKQEKLLVYEYQPHGSLFRLLHGKTSPFRILKCRLGRLAVSVS